jgi:protein TonB
MPISRSTIFWALALSVLLHAAILELVMGLAPAARRVPDRELASLAVRVREAPSARPVEPSALPPPPLSPLMLPPDTSLHANAARAAPPVPRLVFAPSGAPTVAGAQRDPGPQGIVGSGPQGLSGEAARSAYQQMAKALLYPREAIERSIEGEATVLLFLDESGDVIAARLEKTSGYALLDDAAVRAARSLRALPAGAPREALLPVRFRLR